MQTCDFANRGQEKFCNETLSEILWVSASSVPQVHIPTGQSSGQWSAWTTVNIFWLPPLHPHPMPQVCNSGIGEYDMSGAVTLACVTYVHVTETSSLQRVQVEPEKGPEAS
jgi:hypothetical protein